MNWWKLAQNQKPLCILRTSNSEPELKRPQNLWDFADHDNGGFFQAPVVYIRFGDLPLDANGQVTNSMNGHRGVPEGGVSVYPAYYDPKSKKYILASGNEVYLTTQGGMIGRPAYLVEGQEIERGHDDNEPVLDPKTIKVIKKLNPNEMVFEDDRGMSFGDESTEPNSPDAPDFRDDAIYPEGLHRTTPEEKRQKAQEYEKAREMEFQQKQQEYQQRLNAFREIIRLHPEYKEPLERQYPELAKPITALRNPEIK